MYGALLFAAGASYYVMSQSLRTLHGDESTLARAIGSDRKGKISIVLYAAAILIAMWLPLISCLIYAGVAVMWIVPDRRIERILTGASVE